MHVRVGNGSQSWGCSSFSTPQTPDTIFHVSATVLDLTRLYVEKEILEQGLADSVTYLLALRNKKARIDRQLNSASEISCKKKRKLRHLDRELQKDIRNREQREQAFLNNLKACQANIYTAETLSPPSTGLLSTVPAFTSGSTISSVPADSEPVELSWSGWTDDVVTSPFQKHSHSQLIACEIAPDEPAEKVDVEGPIHTDARRSRPLTRYAGGLGFTLLAAPRRLAKSQPPPKALSPEATVSEQSKSTASHADSVPMQRADTLDGFPKLLTTGIQQVRSRSTHEGVACAPRLVAYNSRWALEKTRYKAWSESTPHSLSIVTTM